jgi:hypothetical protein
MAERYTKRRTLDHKWLELNALRRMYQVQNRYNLIYNVRFLARDGTKGRSADIPVRSKLIRLEALIHSQALRVRTLLRTGMSALRLFALG